MLLAELRVRGFDQSSHVPFTKTYSVQCSGCQAAVVNGHPIHETGCPNDTHECNGCNQIIPARQRYCADCI